MLCAAAAFAYYLFSQKLKSDSSYADALGRNRKRFSDDSFGGARFEEPEDYRDKALVQRIDEADGMILGQLDKSGRRLVSLRREIGTSKNYNVMIFGTSGIGKSRTVIMPLMLQDVKCGISDIITDPKGELYRDFAMYYYEHGYRVRRLDIEHPGLSNGWDVLGSISTENAESDAQIFANSIITNSSKQDRDSIFAKGATGLLTALLLRVYFGPEFDESGKFRKFIEETESSPVYGTSFGRILEKNRDLKCMKRTMEAVCNQLQLFIADEHGKESSEAYLNTLFDMRPFSEREGDTPEILDMKRRVRRSRIYYNTFMTASPNLRGNIITHLSVTLNPFKSEEMIRVISKDEIDLELPGMEPCVYFVSFPPATDAFTPVICLFFDMLYIRLSSLANSRPSRSLERRVNFILDEFYSIGTLNQWSETLSTMRSLNMTAAMVCQDRSQVEERYGDASDIIIANCSTHIYLNCNTENTAREIEARCGAMTAALRTGPEKNTFINLLYGNSSQVREGAGRAMLLSSWEAYIVPEDRNIVLLQGHMPMLIYKYDVSQHPEYGRLKELNDEDLTVIDTPEREMMLYAEDEYIRRYRILHPLQKMDFGFYRGEDNEETGAAEILDSIIDGTEAMVRGYKERKNKKEEAVNESPDRDPEDKDDYADARIYSFDEYVNNLKARRRPDKGTDPDSDIFREDDQEEVKESKDSEESPEEEKTEPEAEDAPTEIQEKAEERAGSYTVTEGHKKKSYVLPPRRKKTESRIQTKEIK